MVSASRSRSPRSWAANQSQQEGGPMPYRVRSEGGEVKFQSLYEIQRAIAVGLVAQTDELTEEGTENWRRIDTILALKDAKLEPSGGVDTGRWVIPVAALSAVAV